MSDSTSPSSVPSHPSRRWAYGVAAAALALVIALGLTARTVRTDIVGVPGTDIRFAPEQDLYRSGSGTTFPVRLRVAGVPLGQTMRAARLVLDGWPANVSLSGVSVPQDSGRAEFRRDGSRVIVLLEDLAIQAQGIVLVLMVSVNDDFPGSGPYPIRVVSDADPESIARSAIAVETVPESIEQFMVDDGTLFTLQSETTASASQTGGADGVLCSQEVQRCSDGSYVARDPEKGCDFRPCPTTTCVPRPACLDADPPCMIAVQPEGGWCPGGPPSGCPPVPTTCDALTVVDGCTICAGDAGFRAMCRLCPEGRRGAICPKQDGQYGYSCTAFDPAGDAVLPERCLVCPPPTLPPEVTPTPSPSATHRLSLDFPYAAISAGQPLTMTVCARDAQGSIVTSYRGVVRMSVYKLNVTPIEAPVEVVTHTFSSEDNGCHAFANVVPFTEPGTFSMRIHDINAGEALAVFVEVSIPTPTSTPSPTPTPICLPNGVYCNADSVTDLSCCSGRCTASGSTMVCVPSPTPTVTPTTTPTPTGSGSTMTPSPSPTPLPSPSPTTAPMQCSLPLRGDVNCDGRITIADLVLLADFLAGKAQLSASQISNANVAETAQRRVNLADAAAFVMFLSGQSPTL